MEKYESIDQVEEYLAEHSYIAERSLATSIFLALKLGKPLFLEGEAGVGKTEVAKVLSLMLGRDLIRLQCYEGLDIASAVYEWNFSRQMLRIRQQEVSGAGDRQQAVDLFSAEFLLRRPLLEAVDRNGRPAPVLLIDELDRADEEFEAFLLEILSDFQVTIPELGTIRAQEPPIVVITSNRTREIHDALRRRCFYFWIDYPSFEKECRIVMARNPKAAEELIRQAVAFVQELRKEELYKRPGIAETLDWISALVALNQRSIGEDIIGQTLGLLLKYQDDIEPLKGPALRQVFIRALETG